MWTASILTKEIVNLYLGAALPFVERVLQVSLCDIESLDKSLVHLFWNEKPNSAQDFPSLVIVPDGRLKEILVLIMASPQTPSPLTSISRFLEYSEAIPYFERKIQARSLQSSELCAAVSMIEALIHSDGKLGISQLSPATCKRTFSYAWGKALSIRAPSIVLEYLPSRWLESYEAINPYGAIDSIQRVVSSSMKVFSTCARIEYGLKPEGPEGRLAQALAIKDKGAQADAWLELSAGFERMASLSEMELLNREERGKYLQKALWNVSQKKHEEMLLPMTAFLATRVAPGSLEHLDLLRSMGSPALLLWYGLFATIQSPYEILASQGGLGLRMRREIVRNENVDSYPTADIAFPELCIIGSIGVDDISRKFGHISECEVELAPYVNCSFSYHSRMGRSKQEYPATQLNLEIHEDVRKASVISKDDLLIALSMLTNVVNEISNDDLNMRAAQWKKRKRK